jgi:hypothetical protein
MSFARWFLATCAEAPVAQARAVAAKAQSSSRASSLAARTGSPMRAAGWRHSLPWHFSVPQLYAGYVQAYFTPG